MRETIPWPRLPAFMTSAEREELWEDIRREFRRACLLRQEGHSEEATALINGSISAQIHLWTRETRNAGEPCREPLEKMFEEEMRRVEDAWAVWEILRVRLSDHVFGGLEKEVREMREQLKDLSLEMQIAGHQVRKAAKATLTPFAQPSHAPFSLPQVPTKKNPPAHADSEEPEEEEEAYDESASYYPLRRKKPASKALPPSKAQKPPLPGPEEPYLEDGDDRIPFDNIPAIIDQLIDQDRGNS